LKINAITSPSNPLLKQIRGLHERRAREKSRLFLVEGAKPVAEAFEKRLRIKDVVVSNAYLSAHPDVVHGADLKAISVVDDKLFKEISTTTTPAGVLAVAEMPQYVFADLFQSNRTPLIVVAHAIQDPGNLGTIIRAALAASVTGIVLTKGTVDPFNPKVVRGAMGALFALPIVCDVDYPEAAAQLKERGLRVFACQPGAERNYFQVDWRQPAAIALGNEGQGFSPADLQQADELISIPMNPQSESLNVAVSAAIVLFSAVQQRLTGS
jgi:TrmH family RNA methyltransferase